MGRIERIETTEPVPGASAGDSATLERLAVATERLKARGVLSGKRSRKLSVRVDPELIEAARVKLGRGSDSEVVKAALALMAGVNPFGYWLIRQKGTLPEDFEIGF